ncbi:MAG: ABC transporter ATP-binding protein [Anaerolineae bacterium]|jgi:ABC-2 type transport system ATP-binding protein|nr:ABC transporter ATP-binding protein [Anaerolineae bacterium]
MIHINQLERIFRSRLRRRSVTAVQDLTLSIEPGELFGLVGPDGAGKTTTLRMLAGILKPTSGEATVNGHDIVKEAEAIKQELGYMAQQFGLYPDLTVDENLNFICDVFDVVGDAREQRIQELLDFTNLHDFRQRRARQLSGGMQKKLALTAALVHRPKLLLLDEPTTGVDPVARREFWDILTELHASGSTVIVSTPYMDEAERCNRVGLMYNGRLMVCDTPGAVKRMLPGAVLALRADNLAAAERVLKDMQQVIDVQPYGDVLSVIVTDHGDSAAIEARLSEAGVQVESLRPAPPRLEEAFIYFVRQYAANNHRPIEEVRA